MLPASDNPQFMRPVIVNRFPTPALNYFIFELKSTNVWVRVLMLSVVLFTSFLCPLQHLILRMSMRFSQCLVLHTNYSASVAHPTFSMGLTRM